VRVAFHDDPVHAEHDSGPGHPECPERVEAVRRGLQAARLRPRLVDLPARDASAEELRRVHTEAHLHRLAGTAGRTVRFDPDTQAGPRSYAAAVRAAGAAVQAVDLVLDGEVERAFCAVRPPGHHAGRDRAMGFCLFNNVAVAAAHALARGLRRVLVVDPDVHHGNGTQDIFYEDPRVLYVSTHQFPFYPGTGSLAEQGAGEGRGFTVNLPLPAGLGDGAYARVYREVVAPVAAAFDPELVLVSLGFDPHRADPLAGMALSERGFAEVARVCVEAAQGAGRGRVVCLLEGGYDLGAIAVSAAAVVRVLLGEVPEAPAPEVSAAMDGLLARLRAAHAALWPVLAA
jgi:acetoin utilization deacetylase AcuC-like enzyme